MYAGGRQVVAVAVLALLCAAYLDLRAAANAAQGADDAPGAAQALSRKLELLRRLVGDSPTAARVRDSGSETARAHLEQAQALAGQADEALKAGRLEAASSLINDGLRAGTQAAAAVAKPTADRKQRKRFEELGERVTSFQAAYERMLSEQSEMPGDAVVDLAQIGRLREQANRLAADGDYAGANTELARASETLERALTRGRHRQTLLHQLEFASPSEEYAYERKRNESYRMLASMLGGRYPNAAPALEYLERLLKDNELVRTQAQSLADAGDFPQAITLLERSTERMARALRMSGLAF